MTICVTIKVKDERDCQIEVATMNLNGRVITDTKLLDVG